MWCVRTASAFECCSFFLCRFDCFFFFLFFFFAFFLGVLRGQRRKNGSWIHMHATGLCMRARVSRGETTWSCHSTATECVQCQSGASLARRSRQVTAEKHSNVTFWRPIKGIPESKLRPIATVIDDIRSLGWCERCSPIDLHYIERWVCCANANRNISSNVEIAIHERCAHAKRLKLSLARQKESKSQKQLMNRRINFFFFILFGLNEIYFKPKFWNEVRVCVRCYQFYRMTQLEQLERLQSNWCSDSHWEGDRVSENER